MDTIENLFSLFILLTITCSAMDEGKLIIKPEHPQKGETIEIIYDKSGTPLQSVDKIEAVIYSYGKEILRANEIILKTSGDKLTGKFKLENDISGVVFKFFDGDELIDNNEGNGYYSLLFDENKNPATGAYAGLAEAISDWGEYFTGMKREPETALKYFEKEFEIFPKSKSLYFGGYISTLLAIDKDKAKEIALAELDVIGKKENLTQEELTILQSWYSRFRKTDEAKLFSQRLIEKFPKSEHAQTIRASAFNSEKDTLKKEELFKSFYNDFPESKMLGRMYNIMSEINLAKGLDKLQTFFKEYPKAEKWSFYNRNAIKFSTDKTKVDVAKKFALSAIEIAEAELEIPKEAKPKYQTNKEWKKVRKNNLATAYDTYTTLLINEENEKDALSFLGNAVELSDGKMVEINSKFLKTLKQLKHGEVFNVAENFVKSGNANDEIKEILKEEFVKKNGDEKDFLVYLNKLEEPFKTKIRTSLQKELISLPAPDFTLMNLNGAEINLASLKGKTVIVDFWATWCGPCLVSFPGMQKAVNKFKDDEAVQFLFVNTWENVTEKKTNATQFIEKNNYTFNVLMDEQNEVVAKFKVEGIPTKFVIDKEGNIRFKSVGFGGNTEKMVEELTMMIEMIK
ncbi:MAG: TlpA disulfide reductase family protein [Ignavibacteria bacterium]|nr:TlpA disulfide reductase family protein [Ignavibacteria bacterium]